MKYGWQIYYSLLFGLLIGMANTSLADESPQLYRTKAQKSTNAKTRKALLIGASVALAGAGGMLLQKVLDKKKEKGRIQSQQDDLAFPSPFMSHYISPSIFRTSDDSFFDSTFPDIDLSKTPALLDLPKFPDANFNVNPAASSDGDLYLNERELTQRKNDQKLADQIYGSTRFDKTIQCYSRPDSKSTLNIKKGLDAGGSVNLTLEFNDKSQSQNPTWHRSVKREISFPKSKEQLRELISQFRHAYHFDSNSFI